MKKLILLILPILLLLQACEKSAPVNAPELLTFSLEKANNYSLPEDIIFENLESPHLEYATPFPLHTNIFKATFTVSEGCIVTVNDVVQESGKTSNDFSSAVEYTVTNANGEKKVYTVSLSVNYRNMTGLPILFINTNEGKPVADKENWVAGEYSIMGADGEYILENNELEIRGRGNTTWQNPKKPYALKLGKKTELFGMPKHKRWVLLAAYNDKSFIRTDLAFHLAQNYSNLRWKQGGQLLEVVLNGQYLGNYYLCEHIKIDENRIPDGYVIEVDYRAKEANGDIFFKSKLSQLNFVIKDPEVAKGSAEYLYAENYINTCEQYLKNMDSANYMKYIDLENMVDWYLNSELTKNPDSGFFLSVYMNISADGKLYMGPLWDYDLSFGNQVYDDGAGSDNGYTGFTIRNGDRSKIWLPAMFNNPAFIAMLKEKMRVIAANEAEIMAFIDKRHQELKKSALHNDRRWYLMCPYGSSDETILNAYGSQITYIKEWLHGRIQWLATNIEAL
jgi:hypothetical protein